MLRRRDMELIGGLVEGTLPDESEARALIARSAEARKEYESQRRAYLALTAAEPASLSETERAALHRDLWSALRAEPDSPPRAVRWYYRLAPVAAVLVLLVGGLAVLNRGMQQATTADSFFDLAGGAAADTTVAGATAETFESAGDDAAAPSAESDGSSTAGVEEALPRMIPSEFFASIAESVRSGELTTTTGAFQSDGGEAVLADSLDCLRRAGEDYQIVGQASNLEMKGTREVAMAYIVAVPAGEDIGPDTVVTFVSLDTCEVAHVEPAG